MAIAVGTIAAGVIVVGVIAATGATADGAIVAGVTAAGITAANNSDPNSVEQTNLAVRAVLPARAASFMRGARSCELQHCDTFGMVRRDSQPTRQSQEFKNAGRVSCFGGA
jgi:hypothetical protein